MLALNVECLGRVGSGAGGNLCVGRCRGRVSEAFCSLLFCVITKPHEWLQGILSVSLGYERESLDTPGSPELVTAEQLELRMCSVSGMVCVCVCVCVCVHRRSCMSHESDLMATCLLANFSACVKPRLFRVCMRQQDVARGLSSSM